MYYIVVSGGVISGLGKGITASSIGLILKSYGYNVTAIKIDPYLNVDSGTMSPFEHGECYVLNDGGETDLDLGNYERFLDIDLTQSHSLTSGKMYRSIIDKERKGDYLGKTVQMMPHVTDYIKNYLIEVSRIPINGVNPEICIVELGGTVGDYESNIYFEALSEFSKEQKLIHVHVTLLPVVKNEVKTKPAQQSVKQLRSMGIEPDMMILRCDREVPDEAMNKLSRMCKIQRSNLIVNRDVPTIYHVPKLFMDQSIVEILSRKIPMVSKPDNMLLYYEMLKTIEELDQYPMIKIGIVGKYMGVQDTYLSLIRAIEHASIKMKKNVQILWIDSEKREEELLSELKKVERVIIPGGFGDRGVEGMIYCAKYCREKQVPILGICLGMQIMCIEIDRNIYENPQAGSEEFNKNNNTVILSDAITNFGGTMRLGSYDCLLDETSNAYKYYGNVQTIKERHRHRYEISSNFVSKLTDSQYKVSGVNGRYTEIVERISEPFWLGCQFHPEFKSRQTKPHPLFVSFLK